MLVDGDGQEGSYNTRTCIAPGERGHEEARAGSGGEAKAWGDQWGSLVVVAPSCREGSKAANVIPIVLVSSFSVTDYSILFRLADI